MAPTPADIDAAAESTPQERALAMLTLLESAAADEEWERAETIASKIRSAVLEVSDAERRAVVDRVLGVVQRVQTMALASRGDVVARLSEIRRGRLAQQVYGQSDTSQHAPSLG